MPTNTLILLVYSSLVALGGLMGYIKGGSVISLLAGGGSGLILFILTYLCFKKRKQAEYAALILIFLLDSLFTYRFMKSFHFFPSGLFSLISIITIILLSINLRNKKLTKLKE